MNKVFKKIKKIIYISCTIVFVLTGCGNSETKDSELANLKEMDEITTEDIVVNETVQEKIYDASFLFYEDIEFPEQVELIYEMIEENEEGSLFLVTIDMDDEFSGRDYYGHDRMKLGYFYTTDSIVYYMDELEMDEEITINKIIMEGKIIYAEKEIYESLGIVYEENDYLEFDNGNCIHHYFNDLVETGYYRTIVWNKEQGLIMFKNGFGAMSESISLVKQGIDIGK